MSPGPAECGLVQAWGLGCFTVMGGLTVGGLGAEEGPNLSEFYEGRTRSVMVFILPQTRHMEQSQWELA